MRNQNEILSKIANELFEANKTGIPIEPISKRYSNLNIDDAYSIQLLNIDRIVSNGEQITGKKIGLTSLAMQQSLGVNQPDFGFLYKSMEILNNKVPAKSVMQPRVEGELAFMLKQTIYGDVTIQQVLDATEFVVPAIEIVGTRIKDWKLTIIDTIADNASCGMYLLGNERIHPAKTDLKKIPMTLSQNGEVINSGYGSAVLGDPANAVAWLAKQMWNYGVKLNKGDIVLSGAFTAAISASSGDSFTCDYGDFGTVCVDFE